MAALFDKANSAYLRDTESIANISGDDLQLYAAFQLDELPTTTDFVVCSWGYLVSSGLYFGIVVNTAGKIILRHSTGFGTDEVDSGVTATTGQLYRVLIRNDQAGNNLYIDVDGAPKASGTYVGSSTSGRGLYVGAAPLSGTAGDVSETMQQFYDGYVDDFAGWLLNGTIFDDATATQLTSGATDPATLGASGFGRFYNPALDVDSSPLEQVGTVTYVPLPGGRTIDNVDGDNTVFAGQQDFTVNCTGLDTNPTTQIVRMDGLTLPITDWNNGSPIVSAPITLAIPWDVTGQSFDVTDDQGTVEFPPGVAYDAAPGWEIETYSVAEAPTDRSFSSKVLGDFGITPVFGAQVQVEAANPPFSFVGDGTTNFVVDQAANLSGSWAWFDVNTNIRYAGSYTINIDGQETARLVTATPVTATTVAANLVTGDSV